MQQQSSEADILEYFKSSGDLYSTETEVLGATIREITAAKGHVTNKAIILHLLAALESSEDVLQQDILRSTLELVVGRTPDDSDI